MRSGQGDEQKDVCERSSHVSEPNPPMCPVKLFTLEQISTSADFYRVLSTKLYSKARSGEIEARDLSRVVPPEPFAKRKSDENSTAVGMPCGRRAALHKWLLGTD